MDTPVAVAGERASLIEVLNLMCVQNVRRVPLVSAGSSLRGIVTADDVIKLLVSELSLVADAVGRQLKRERQLGG